MTPTIEQQNRLAYFRRGYGDGAKGSAYKHPENADYMRGWACGAADARHSAQSFCERNEIPLPSILREPT